MRKQCSFVFAIMGMHADSLLPTLLVWIDDLCLVCNDRRGTLCCCCQTQNMTRVVVCLQDMLQLSDEQIKDLMFVRQVTYAKQHFLASQLEAVATKIHEDSPSPIVKFNKLSASAIQLQQQALDQHDVVHRVRWAVHCGVCGHPWIPSPSVLYQLSSDHLLLCMPITSAPHKSVHLDSQVV